MKREIGRGCFRYICISNLKTYRLRFTLKQNEKPFIAFVVKTFYTNNYFSLLRIKNIIDRYNIHIFYDVQNASALFRKSKKKTTSI